MSPLKLMGITELGSKFELAGKISAVIASLGVLASMLYEWGFLSGLGLGFVDAPTSLSDHIRSWLVWLPSIVFATLGILLFELLTRRIEEGLSEDEIVKRSPNPKRLARFRRSPRIAFEILAVAIVGLWLLFGVSFRPGLGLGLIVCWFLFSGWVFAHPTVRERHTEAFRLFVHWVPPVMIWFYFSGLNTATARLEREGTPNVLHVKSSSGTTEKFETALIRSYDHWLLVRDAKGRIVWVRSDETIQIENPSPEPAFPGLLCRLSDVLCLSKNATLRRQP